jgi:hypothetical protein
MNANKQAAETTQVPGRFNFLFSWTGLLLIGWIVYELTSQASLGVTMLCCKLGWEELRTAVWLRRRDSVPARGKIEFWIFVASGLFKSTLSGLILSIVIAMFTFPQNNNAQPGAFKPPDEFMEATLIWMVGGLTTALATL